MTSATVTASPDAAPEGSSPGEYRVAPGGASGVAGPAAERAGRRATVNVSYTFRRLPERAGVVEVTMRLPASPAVERLSVRFREEVRVVETTNVESTDRAYEWRGERPGAVVYRVPINWTYTGNRRSSWTLVGHRSPTVQVDGPATLRETVRVAGEGYVGNTTVLLGAHDVVDRRVAGDRIRVVVPAGVEGRLPPEEAATALANAARSLSIAGRDQVTHVFLTPEILIGATQLEQPGFALDDNTLLIDVDSEFDVWTHEYVHARQEFPDSPERLRWLTEGSAEYYGWLLSIEQGYDDWAPLQSVFTRGRDDDSVLAAPDTWRGETEYTKGALVLGVLDRDIRRATDGEHTLEDVLRRVNRDPDPTLETFFEAVREVGGPAVADTARRYVTTAAWPSYQPSPESLARLYDGTGPVTDRQGPTTGTDTTGGAGPGLGPVTVLGALALAVAVGRRLGGDRERRL